MENIFQEEEDDGFFEYQPPAYIADIPPFLNTAKKWTDCVYTCNCVHKLTEIYRKINLHSQPQEDKRMMIRILVQDVINTHCWGQFFNHSEENCLWLSNS